jgi:hypothetical protein
MRSIISVPKREELDYKNYKPESNDNQTISPINDNTVDLLLAAIYYTSPETDFKRNMNIHYRGGQITLVSSLKKKNMEI